MKRGLFLAAALMLAGGSALAVPYASQIRISTTNIVEGNGATISYVLNEAADSVTVEVLDGSSAVVATFAGTTTAGVNTVAWDGTDDNAGGTPLAVDTGYTIEITADKNAAVAWTEFVSQESLGEYGPPATKKTVFDGFSGKDLIISKDSGTDIFGLIGATSSFSGTTPPHKGVVVFNTALDVDAGDDGFNSRVLRHPDTDGIEPVVGSNQDTWGVAIDPVDPNLVWIVGQPADSGADVMKADVTSGYGILLDNADPDDSAAADTANARGIAVKDVGGTKYIYLALGNNAINRLALDANNEIVDGVVDILETDGADRYSKNVLFDDAGNLYWVNRASAGSGAGGRLYRWDAATVDAATAGSLTDANATWVVDAAGDDVKDAAFGPNGEVYLVDSTGVSLVGNVSDAAVVKTLTAGDLVIDFTTVGTGWSISSFGSGAESDVAGNIYIVDTSTEQVRAFSPGGNTSVAISGPDSQTFQVSELVTSATGWNLYE